MWAGCDSRNQRRQLRITFRLCWRSPDTRSKSVLRKSLQLLTDSTRVSRDREPPPCLPGLARTGHAGTAFASVMAEAQDVDPADCRCCRSGGAAAPQGRPTRRPRQEPGWRVGSPTSASAFLGGALVGGRAGGKVERCGSESASGAGNGWRVGKGGAPRVRGMSLLIVNEIMVLLVPRQGRPRSGRSVGHRS